MEAEGLGVGWQQNIPPSLRAERDSGTREGWAPLWQGVGNVLTWGTASDKPKEEQM